MSLIKLFKTEIIPQKNMWVDNIESYLNSLPSTRVYDNYQFDKLELNCEKTIDMSQSGLFLNDFSYNYLSVKNNDVDFTAYYFIASYKWAGKRAVKLKLVLDTLNTFGDKLVFTDKTTLVREHEPRFVRGSDIGEDEYLRVIDKISEGINPLMVRESATKIEDVAGLNQNFYLMYRNSKTLSPENTDNPVNCFLVADNKMLLKAGSENPVISITPDQLNEGYYYATFEDNGPGKIWGVLPGDQHPKESTLSSTIRAIEINVHGSAFGVREIHYKIEEGYLIFDKYVSWGIAPYRIELRGIKQLRHLVQTTSLTDINSFPFILYNSGMVADIKTISFKEIDRTDPRIIKIIKLPYAPANFSIVNGELFYDKLEWEYVEGMLKLKDLSLEFGRELFYKFDIHEIKCQLPSNLSTTIGTQYKDKRYESKLFHSDFYINKLVYDSFEYTLHMETLGGSDVEDFNDRINIKFKPTNTINSNFLFTLDIPDFNVKGYENFPHNLLVKRNNEVTIFNSEYINYIKTGFNYDKKTLARETGMNWLNTGLQIAGGALSFALGGVTGGLSIVAGAGLITSAVSSIAGNINTQINSEQRIQQKLDTLKMSPASVSGCDDIDLMSDYSGNRAWQIIYTPTSEMIEAIFDLFYYCGYSTPVQRIPALNSRIYFNYIQCSPVFAMDTINNVKNDYLSDIIERFKIGVTKYHNFKGNYDFAQVLENWEVWLNE